MDIPQKIDEILLNERKFCLDLKKLRSDCVMPEKR